MADPLNAGAPAGSNLRPDTLLELYSKWRTARRLQGEAGSAVQTTKKAMKSAGVDIRAFDMMEKINDLDEDEAVTMFQTIFRYGRWLNMPFAKRQGDLFGSGTQEDPSKEAQEEHARARAKDDGYFAGRDGHRKDSNPHPAGSIEAQGWAGGWIEGAAARESRGGSPDPKPAAAENATNGTRGRGSRGRKPANDQAEGGETKPAAEGSAAVN